MPVNTGGTAMYAQTIGKRIWILRKTSNLTQAELAQRLYVSNNTVSSWERDRTNPDIAVIVQIAKIFHVSLNYLLVGEKKITL